MATPETPTTMLNPAQLESFTTHLKSSKRILALLGAGLSASSGLPTFRGAGGLWRSYDATTLATPGAFDHDPGLVWQFYSYRRAMAKRAEPNPAHHALSALARKMNTDRPPLFEGFLCLSQNVDGLSPRAGHTEDLGLRLLHGSLWDVPCSNKNCDYILKDSFEDPVCPALTIPLPENGDVADITTSLPRVSKGDLPHCPKCNSLLRPGVVWFGEPLPKKTMSYVDAWVVRDRQIDLMIVIGTSSAVYPAAGYTHLAKRLGAKVAVVNLEAGDAPEDTDWLFCGDAAQILPELLKPLIEDEPGWRKYQSNSGKKEKNKQGMDS